MAEVELNFDPPDISGLTALDIFESSLASGPFTLVESVAAIGSYPDYITRYKTLLAANVNNWFAVQWRKGAAAVTPLSPPMKGGAASFVQQIVERVRQRDKSLDEDVVTQEAEAAIERYFGKNPYTASLADIAEGLTFQVLNGLTYLTMARSILARLTKQANVQSATLGMVSMKTGETETSIANVESLLDMAARELGLAVSVVVQMAEVEVAAGSLSSYDHSRLIGYVGLE